jgi:hypothetical protein
MGSPERLGLGGGSGAVVLVGFHGLLVGGVVEFMPGEGDDGRQADERDAAIDRADPKRERTCDRERETGECDCDVGCVAHETQVSARPGRLRAPLRRWQANELAEDDDAPEPFGRELK